MTSASFSAQIPVSTVDRQYSQYSVWSGVLLTGHYGTGPLDG